PAPVRRPRRIPGGPGSTPVPIGGGGGSRTRVRSSVPRDLYERVREFDLAAGLLPTGSLTASGGLGPGPEPPRLRTGKPAFVTPLARPAGAAGGGARDLGPGTRSYATYAARAS